MDEYISIIIESESLDQDDPDSNLICITLDGKFHRVKSLPASMHEEVPPGWEIVKAIRKIIKDRKKAILIQID